MIILIDETLDKKRRKAEPNTRHSTPDDEGRMNSKADLFVYGELPHDKQWPDREDACTRPHCKA